jgi:hypothetical protein
LLEKRPSISLQPFVLVIQDSRFRSRSLCSVGPTVRHGFLAVLISLVTSNLSFDTRTGGRIEEADDPEISCNRRRHMFDPLKDIHRRSQVGRMLFVLEHKPGAGWKECSARICL